MGNEKAHHPRIAHAIQALDGSIHYMDAALPSVASTTLRLFTTLGEPWNNGGWRGPLVRRPPTREGDDEGSTLDQVWVGEATGYWHENQRSVGRMDCWPDSGGSL